MVYCRTPGDTEEDMRAAFARDARLHPDIAEIEAPTARQIAAVDEEIAVLRANVDEASEDFERTLVTGSAADGWAALLVVTRARAELERLRREMGDSNG
jgi:hypothetical protein